MAHNMAKNAVDRDVFSAVHPLKLPPHPPPSVDTPASTSRYTRLHHHKGGAWFAAKEEPGLSKRRSLVCHKGGAYFHRLEAGVSTGGGGRMTICTPTHFLQHPIRAKRRCS